MTSTAALRREHSRILHLASLLRGLAVSRMTPDVASQARTMIDAMGRVLVDHLNREDDQVYRALMSNAEPAVRELATDCFADMGGLLSAWTDYRDRWTLAAIQASPGGFAAATTGVIDALACRIERENEDLYPLFDQIEATADQVIRVA